MIYVSPKSGRAVSRDSGAPYHDRLLPLPGFLGDESPEAGSGAVAEAFRLTGYFLERDVFQPRGLPMPQARQAYLANYLAQIGGGARRSCRKIDCRFKRYA